MYYHNSKTNTPQWNKPKDFDGEDLYAEWQVKKQSESQLIYEKTFGIGIGRSTFDDPEYKTNKTNKNYDPTKGLIGEWEEVDDEKEPQYQQGAIRNYIKKQAKK